MLAPTLAGHAGGPPLRGRAGAAALLDAVEQAMDDAGFRTAHLAGNSLGGYLALRLAERGRARSVVALAPAGGRAAGGDSPRRLLLEQAALQEELRRAAPHVDALVATAAGRRRATALLGERHEHIPAGLVAHQLAAAAASPSAGALMEHALESSWPLAAERVDCPMRIVWGDADRVLPWPAAAARYRERLPHADWVVLAGVGHCPQLDVPLETAELIAGFAGGSSG
jgi:pimeloyl-ACP methyl ester carboxylesterase